MEGAVVRAILVVLGVACATLTTSPASADQAPIPLATGADLRMDGATVSERVGSSLATGDINGDGIQDLVMGAPGADRNSRSNSGSVYVLFGRSGFGAVDLANLGNAGFRVDGAAANDAAGTSVTTTDFNGDGKDDVVIGATGAGGSGAAFVIFGRTSTTNIDLDTFGGQGVRINGGASGDAFGTSVAGIADVDDDGRDEVAIGATGADPNGSGSGSVSVVLGTTSTASINSSSLGIGGYTIRGAAALDASGSAVANAGDVNDDGLDDLIVGALNASPSARGQAGSAFVVFGTTVPDDVNLGSLGSAGVRIDGESTLNQLGGSARGIGDINNDGVDDIAIGAAGAATNAGKTYVIFGNSGIGNIDLLNPGATGFALTGASAGDKAGTAIAGGADLNDDGTVDLVTTALQAANTFNLSGSSYVVFGGADTSNRSLTNIGQFGFRIDGGSLAEFSGAAVELPDINNDGGADILIGAPRADFNSLSDSGSVYVLFGTAKPQPPTPPATPTPPPGAQQLSAATLTVKARAASKSVTRDGAAVLVKRVTVGAGQSKTVNVKVSPKKARKSITVKTRKSGRVSVRTDSAPRARIKVTIRATGSGLTPAAFTRTWKVR